MSVSTFTSTNRKFAETNVLNNKWTILKKISVFVNIALDTIFFLSLLGFFVFNGMSALVGYLMTKPSLKKNSCGTI